MLSKRTGMRGMLLKITIIRITTKMKPTMSSKIIMPIRAQNKIHKQEMIAKVI